MRLKGRARAGNVVVALTVSAGVLSAGAANATVVWDQHCTDMYNEAWIQSNSPSATYCYYGTGTGYSNVSGVYNMYSGQYTAVWQTSAGAIGLAPYTQYFPNNIHTYNFQLS